MLGHITSLGISMRWDDCDHPSVDLDSGDRWCDVVAALVLDGDNRERQFRRRTGGIRAAVRADRRYLVYVAEQGTKSPDLPDIS